MKALAAAYVSRRSRTIGASPNDLRFDILSASGPARHVLGEHRFNWWECQVRGVRSKIVRVLIGPSCVTIFTNCPSDEVNYVLWHLWNMMLAFTSQRSELLKSSAARDLTRVISSAAEQPNSSNLEICTCFRQLGPLSFVGCHTRRIQRRRQQCLSKEVPKF